MSTPIPEDVMKTARRLAKKAVYHGGVDWATDDIALALMAEREACAMVALNFPYEVHGIGTAIASAIRDRSKT